VRIVQYPLSKLLVALVSGIVISEFLTLDSVCTLTVLIVLSGLLIIALGYLRYTIKSKRIFDFAILITVVFYGFLISNWQKQPIFENKKASSNKIFFASNPSLITIEKQLQSNVKYHRFFAKVTLQDHATQRILLSVPKIPKFDNLNVGSRLASFSATVQLPKPSLPDSFDYAAYLNKQNIDRQIYIQPNQTIAINDKEKSLAYYCFIIRNQIITNLANSGFDKTALHVTEALILGQRQEIDSEIRTNYQSAGVVHLLCVSGLHVGILVFFLDFILVYLLRISKISWLRPTILLGVLFFYALLTGFSASVVRSVCMYSLFVLGFALQRPVKISNTIIASLFLILAFEPQFLFDIGFQLSYLAVIFIVWLTPIFESMWQPKQSVIEYFWKIFCVSLAAQLGTLPLILFYFNQFPTLFFLSNMILIPLVGLIMIFGMLLFAGAYFTTYNPMLIKPVEFSIQVMNTITAEIAAQKWSLIQGVKIDVYTMCLLYLLIVTSLVMLIKPAFNKMVWFLVTVICFQSYLIFFDSNKKNGTEWIVANQYKSTLIFLRNNKNLNLFKTDTTALNKYFDNYLKNNNYEIASSQKLRNTFYFNDKRILLIDSSAVFEVNTTVDVLVLVSSPKVNLNRVLDQIKPAIVVADASNYNYLIKQWEASCRYKKIPFHATAEMGFFKLN
jgi:competence protein ComEC